MCALPLPHQPQVGLLSRKEFPLLPERGEGRFRNVQRLFVRWWQRLPLSTLLRRGRRDKPPFPASVPGLICCPGDSFVSGKERCRDAVLAAEESAPALAQGDFFSEWMKRGALLSLIMDAAQTVEWPESELRLAANSAYAFRRLVLLTVVTYCYATGVYGSKAIAQRIDRDEILRFLCAGTFPTWQDIRDFTHHNHELIKRSLIRTCQLAHEFGSQPGAPGVPNFRRKKLGGISNRTQPDRELQFAAAAESWIQQAEDSDAILCTPEASTAHR